MPSLLFTETLRRSPFLTKAPSPPAPPPSPLLLETARRVRTTPIGYPTMPRRGDGPWKYAGVPSFGQDAQGTETPSTWDEIEVQFKERGEVIEKSFIDWAIGELFGSIDQFFRFGRLEPRPARLWSYALGMIRRGYSKIGSGDIDAMVSVEKAARILYPMLRMDTSTTLYGSPVEDLDQIMALGDKTVAGVYDLYSVERITNYTRNSSAIKAILASLKTDQPDKDLSKILGDIAKYTLIAGGVFLLYTQGKKGMAEVKKSSSKA